jgi:ABC-type uncharacterized transport system YnjBCD substrate-binding protein
MKIELDVNITPSKAMLVNTAIKTLAENLDADNLNFLASQSKKQKVNEKLAGKKTMINMFL